ncbi:MAG: ABC transporter substrate-binding protein [Pseudomonadota bacterium]
MLHIPASALLSRVAASGAAAKLGDIHVGAVLPADEQGAMLGRLLTVEVERINAAGGIGGRVLRVTATTAGRSDQALQVATRLAFETKVLALISASDDAAASPLVDIATRAQVPLLLSSAQAARLTAKGSAWVFRLALSDRFTPTLQQRAASPALAEQIRGGTISFASYHATAVRPAQRAAWRNLRDALNVADLTPGAAQLADALQVLRLAARKTKLRLAADSLKADRTLLRDGLARISDFKGLTAGTISFCTAPSPQCRDGLRTGLIIKDAATPNPRVIERVKLGASTGI